MSTKDVDFQSKREKESPWATDGYKCFARGICPHQMGFTRVGTARQLPEILIYNLKRPGASHLGNLARKPDLQA